MTFSTIARLVLPLAAAAVLTACAPRPEDVAQVPQDVAGYGPVEDGDITVPAVDPQYLVPPNRKAKVAYNGEEAPGTIVVDPFAKFLYLVEEGGMATRYPYDSHESEHDQSLRGSTPEIAEELRRQLDERLDQAGVDVLESRISHLAYAPEIAQAMLQRQQASAIIAARQKIVDGAVGMVEMALTKLAEMEVVELDQERRAAMVSNLLVVLCSDRATTPVVNTGSLY